MTNNPLSCLSGHIKYKTKSFNVSYSFQPMNFPAGLERILRVVHQLLARRQFTPPGPCRTHLNEPGTFVIARAITIAYLPGDSETANRDAGNWDEAYRETISGSEYFHHGVIPPDCDLD